MNDDQNARAVPDLFTKMWGDFASQMMRAGTAFSPDKAPPDMTQEMRSAMFKAWGEYFDQYMRSPDFLQAVQRSMSASVQARKQWNEIVGQLQHEFQLATRQDVDQILSSIHHAERRVIDRIEDLSQQMEDLEERLKSADKSKHAGGGKKKKSDQD